MKKSKKIFVLVGEESGDIIASDLIHEIKIQNRDKFDVILGMYHDQVLSPMKTLKE